MINIISRSFYRRSISGPKKVVDNLIKGLRQMGYPYVVNRRLDACKRLWIHDDTAALREIKNLSSEIKIVIGPNLFVLPRQIPRKLDLSRAVYLQPSQWAKEFWRDFGFNRCPLEVWAAGIDAQTFAAKTQAGSYVLVYFKQRSLEELRQVEDILRRQNINYKILRYGKYNERQYKEALNSARYVVWLGRQESQGVALEEALAMNVPVLVCDVSFLGQWSASPKQMAVFNREENPYTNVTSAPYFDWRCGLKIKDLGALGESLGQMEASFATFRPRAYILEKLSLSGQAKALLDIYEKHFGLSIKEGYQELLLRQGDWINRSPARRIEFFLRDCYRFFN